MNSQPELPRRRDDALELVERPDTAARAAVCVLEHDDARRLDVLRRGDDVAELLRRDPARYARQPVHDETGMDRRPARLEDHDVGPLLRE